MIEKHKSSRDLAFTSDPATPFWLGTRPVYADKGPHGEMQAQYRTEIRSRWTDKNLYLLFICPYQTLNLKPQPSTSTETFRLRDWDVAEVFIGSDFHNIGRYKEFESLPQGEWVDLDIDLAKPQQRRWLDLELRFRRNRSHRSGGEDLVRIPFSALVGETPHAGQEVRINLFAAKGHRLVGFTSYGGLP